jgi:DNA polymerase-1
MPRPKLVIIDANSLIYRAFFALPALTTADGVPTNAVYGYATMLLKLIEEERPEVILAAQEGGRTFRHAEFQSYKAQRPRAPDDLAAQGPLARELTEAFRIPVVQEPGYEADDVVATLAEAGQRDGFEVLIVTGDLDALQLVGPHVRAMVNRRGLSDTVVYDEAAVRERFGLEPSQLPDYKALRGDPSDNIPGVPGIGEKTATRLLQQYGSLEALLERRDDVAEARIRAALEAADQQPLLYKRLATVIRDLSIAVDWEAWRYPGPDLPALRDLCLRLEFRTLLRRLPEGERTEVRDQRLAGAVAQAGPGRMADTEVSIENGRTSSPDWEAWHGRGREAGAAAVRTLVGRHDEGVTLRGLSLATGARAVTVGGPAGEDPLGLFAEAWQIPEPARALLSDPSLRLIGHDLKADLRALRRTGLSPSPPVFDTLVAAYLLHPGRAAYRLADLAREHLGMLFPDEEEPLSRLGREAVAVSLLREPLEARLRAEGLDALNREMEVPLIRILAEMEEVGVRIDPDHLRRLSQELSGQIAALQARVYQAAGQEFNIGSPKQLQQVLFEKLGLKPGKKTPTGALSTGVEVLEELAAGGAEIARLILEYRELTKIKSTYVDALPALAGPDGRVHTSLNQTVAATGRLSSSEPNLQNIPVRTELGRQVRAAFVPAAGMWLLSADYSQIELRILAHVTGDPELRRAFSEEEDVHTRTATRLYDVPVEQVTPEMRRRAKTINFAVIYGMSDFGLARELGISVPSAKEMIEAYFARFPGVVRYTQETIRRAREDGYVCTLLGRKRPIPEVRSANRSHRQAAERAAVNAPIQGTAADIIKRAMIRVDQALVAEGFRSRMILQVHDELLFEAPPEELDRLAPLVRREMEDAFTLDVPLRVETKAGENWRDMTSWMR